MYDNLSNNVKYKLFFHHLKETCYKLSFEHEITGILANILDHIVDYFDASNGAFYLAIGTKMSCVGAVKESIDSEVTLTDHDERKLISSDFILEEEELSFYPSLLQLNERGKVKILAPLSYNNNLFGFITIGKKINQLDFDESEKVVLSLIANFLARMIFYSHSYLEVSGKSSEEMFLKNIIDPLSGAYIRSYTEQRMSESVKESIRYHHPDSFVLMKIDNVSDIRNKYGQQTVNNIIQLVGGAIKHFIRIDVDLVGRFNEDTFIILLPSTEHEGCKVFSERLKSRIQSMKNEKSFLPPVTLSVGITSLEKEDKSKNDIIHKLKEALEHSVGLGGNKLSFKYQGILSENLSDFEKFAGISSEILMGNLQNDFVLKDENGNEINFTAPIKKHWMNIPKQH
jgi:diguanylate cyclase (GGDEF)-like protein